jgi:HSP20 family protein
MSQVITKNKSIWDLFDDQFMNPGYLIRPLHGDSIPNSIKVDIKENKKTIKVVAEVPGVNKNDINVDVDGAVLTISTEIRQFDEKKEDEKTIRAERYYGLISRRITLPAEVDIKGSSAKYDNGVLELVLKKSVESPVQRIKID